MKKYIFLFVLVVLIFVIGVPYAWNLPSDNPSTEVEKVSENSMNYSDNGPFQIAVLSNVELSLDSYDKGNDNFQNALKDLKKIAPHYNVLSVVGDLTKNGLTDEYDVFNDNLKKYKLSKSDIFMTMGNQEYGETTLHNSVTDTTMQKRFIKKEKTDNIYYDKWYGGYHFITLAGEQSSNSIKKSTDDAILMDGAYISDKQFSWFEDTLKKDAITNKPIFVFLHQPLRDTVNGSKLSAGFDEDKVYELLSHYPQVIFISGHSGYSLNNSDRIVQGAFTMVNAGAVKSVKDDNGLVPTLSQGLLINVYLNKVIIKSREFSNHTWINETTIPLSLGKWNTKEKKTFYTDEAGQKMTGFIRDNDFWYYINEDGSMKTGWQQINGKWHFFKDDGKMAFGWIEKDKKRYFLNRKGEMSTGWLEDNSKWYYLRKDGSSAVKSMIIEGQKYDFKDDGEYIPKAAVQTGH